MKCPKCRRELDIDFTAEGSLSVICGKGGLMAYIDIHDIDKKYSIIYVEGWDCWGNEV